MSKKHNIVADYIAERYRKRISGDDLKDGERLVGEDPAVRIMTGVLAEDRVEESFEGGYIENKETMFQSVPSISLQFIANIKENALIHIIPRGILFYTVAPQYDEVCAFFIKKLSGKDKTKYSNVSEIIEKHGEEKYDLPKVYKGIRLEKIMSEGIALTKDELLRGKLHLEEAISEKLANEDNRLKEEIRIIPDSQISISDLENEQRFMLNCTPKDGMVTPGWRVDIYCSAKENESGGTSVFLQMVNKTAPTRGNNSGYLPRVYNAGLRINGMDGVEFKEIKLDYFDSSYQKREPVYSIAENTSSRFEEKENAILTENIPVYKQNRLVTNDSLSKYSEFEALIKNPIESLEKIHAKMLEDYQKRERDAEKQRLSDSARRQLDNDLNDYDTEIKLFKEGIEQIQYKDSVKRAFIYMNRTFQYKLGGDQRSITGWRLFQIVYIVSLIRDVISSEYPGDQSLRTTDIDVASLLYFPTGGGKTEAFLGITVFSMFFDRIRGKNHGVTAILKYPLRLLAVQQLERVLMVIMKANAIKETIPDLKETSDFELGFFVGKENTPNKISTTEPLSNRGEQGNKPRILDSDQDTLNDYYRFIDTCPSCRERSVNIHFNTQKWTLEHRCDSEKCNVKHLPLYIVDNEIYRFLPAVIVSTVDKMAGVGFVSEFKMLFGQVKGKCALHGFTCKNRCLAECDCQQEINKVDSLKDPVPSLFIQDEMHLVKESLGTFDSHYESFIHYFATNLVPESQRKSIRYIGATATISHFDEHIKQLYHMDGRRFPCAYPDVERGKDFYSYTDKSDVTRIIMGFAPYGRSITNGVWQSVYAMRIIVNQMFENLPETIEDMGSRGTSFPGTIDDLREVLYDYWIELVYNNRKDDVMNLTNAFENQANDRLEERNLIKFKTEQMTSDTDFQQVRKTLFDIQANHKKLDETNLILATSTISHGVDEDSFNSMFFYGMPGNNAEYIQAYSRVGRKYTGIVVDIIRVLRVRDRSYLKNFVIFHQNKDDLVESVPINRWAKNAIYSTLPGLFMALILQHYDSNDGTGSLYKAQNVRKCIEAETIKYQDVVERLIEIYGCSESEQLSTVYESTIKTEVDNYFRGILNETEDCFTSDTIKKVSHGRKSAMNSLRDTEETLEIQVR